jgi:NADH-quinone oxidoreductase subunit A
VGAQAGAGWPGQKLPAAATRRSFGDAQSGRFRKGKCLRVSVIFPASGLDTNAAQIAQGRAKRGVCPGVAMNEYTIFLLYLLAILGFVGFTLFLNKVLGPKPAASKMKLEPFECGATPIERINVKAVPVKYYGIAIVFILFDLETVFLFIWALGAQPVNGLMVLIFGIFIALLTLILLYVWKSRLIEDVTG